MFIHCFIPPPWLDGGAFLSKREMVRWDEQRGLSKMVSRFLFGSWCRALHSVKMEKSVTRVKKVGWGVNDEKKFRLTCKK